MRSGRDRDFSIAAAWCGAAGLLYYFFLQVLNGAAQLCLRFRMPEGPAVQPPGAVLLAVLSLAIGAGALAATAIVLLRFGPRVCRPEKVRRDLWDFFVPVFFLVMQAANLLAAAIRSFTGTEMLVEPPAGGTQLGVYLLSVCVVPALGEEFLFRGVLQGILRPYGAWTAITAQAIVFALLHQEISQCVVAFLCALFFGWMAQVTGSLRTGMILHLCNNSLSALQGYLLQYGYAQAAYRMTAAFLLLFPLWGGWTILRDLRSGRLRTMALPRGEYAPSALLRSPGFVVAAAGLLILCLARNFYG